MCTFVQWNAQEGVQLCQIDKLADIDTHNTLIYTWQLVLDWKIKNTIEIRLIYFKRNFDFVSINHFFFSLVHSYVCRIF